MTRKALPPETKRIAFCLVCSPTTVAQLKAMAGMSGLPVGRVVDRLIERQTKKETK